jgi:hypothetical protein
MAIVDGVWTLPETWNEDLVDEEGVKLSKR